MKFGSKLHEIVAKKVFHLQSAISKEWFHGMPHRCCCVFLARAMNSMQNRHVSLMFTVKLPSGSMPLVFNRFYFPLPPQHVTEFRPCYAMIIISNQNFLLPRLYCEPPHAFTFSIPCVWDFRLLLPLTWFG